MRFIAAIARFVRDLVLAPFDLLRDLLGMHGPVLPPADDGLDGRVADVADGLRQELESAGRRTRPAAGPGLGASVHAYAAGDRAARDAFDMSKLPERVAVALLTMPPDQIARLASAGPAACARWVAGKRCGIVGIALPETDWHVRRPARDEAPPPAPRPMYALRPASLPALAA